MIPARGRRARPRKRGNEVLHHVVSLRLTQGEMEALVRLCNRTSRSISDVLRDALHLRIGDPEAVAG